MHAVNCTQVLSLLNQKSLPITYQYTPLQSLSSAAQSILYAVALRSEETCQTTSYTTAGRVPRRQREVITLRGSQLSSMSTRSSSAYWKVGLVLLIFRRGPPPKPILLIFDIGPLLNTWWGQCGSILCWLSLFASFSAHHRHLLHLSCAWQYSCVLSEWP